MEPQEWLHQPDVWQLQQHDVKQRPADSVGSASSRTSSQRLTNVGRRFTVVLDLDETLVWTQRSEHYASSAACGRQAPPEACQGAFSVSVWAMLSRRECLLVLHLCMADLGSMWVAGWQARKGLRADS